MKKCVSFIYDLKIKLYYVKTIMLIIILFYTEELQLFGHRHSGDLIDPN